MNRIKGLRGEEVGEIGINLPKNIHAYMHSPWTETAMRRRPRGGGDWVEG